MYDYGLGKHRDKGIRSNEFLASTAVDFAQAGLIGLAAAGAVAGGIALAGIVGFTAVATAPLWAAGTATALLGYTISRIVDRNVDMDGIKKKVASGFETFPGIIENGKTIVSVGAKRVKESVQNKISNTVKSTKRVISEKSKEVKKTITNFVGGLFGNNGG
jgi:hypothetical protein